MSSSYSSYSSVSYSSSTTQNGQSHTSRVSEHSHSNDRDGTTTVRRTEGTGQPTVEETTYVPAAGQLPRGSASDTRGRIEDVTDEEQKKRDEEYLERMEDEYAKREGGA